MFMLNQNPPPSSKSDGTISRMQDALGLVLERREGTDLEFMPSWFMRRELGPHIASSGN